MTIRHKVKLIFCRIKWWLNFLDEAHKYKEFKRVKKMLIIKNAQLLEEEKKNIESSVVKRLRIEVQLLSELL